MHAAGTLNRFRDGDDGRAACHKINGGKLENELAEIGECVWYFRPTSQVIDKADTRCTMEDV